MNTKHPSRAPGCPREIRILLGILALALLSPMLLPAPLYAAPGAIWTTRGDCGDEQQNVNHYAIGETVYINGANFKAGSYAWDITGQPGQASLDPGLVVANGNIDVGEAGNFCFAAYVVADDDGGEYKATVDGKHDNYRVKPKEPEPTIAPPPPATNTPVPAPTNTPVPPAPTETPIIAPPPPPATQTPIIGVPATWVATETPIIAPPPPATQTPIPLLPTWTAIPFEPTQTPIIAPPPPPPATNTPIVIAPPPPIIVTATPIPVAPTQPPIIIAPPPPVIVTATPIPALPTQTPIVVEPVVTETPFVVTATPALVLVPTGPAATQTPVVIIAPPTEPAPPQLPVTGIDRWTSVLAWVLIGLGTVAVTLSAMMQRRRVR